MRPKLLASFFNVGSPSLLPLFDQLRSVFLITIQYSYYDNVVKWYHIYLKSIHVNVIQMSI